MNIFIDTTLTHQDPFFKTVTNKMLLKLVKELGGTIYMSSVVLEETKEHLKKNINERIKKLRKDIDEYNKLTKTKIELEINENIESYVWELENFYEQLENNNILKIIDYENDILPIIAERKIKQKKLFSENKDRFRDAIIWLSYANNITNANLLDKCYFITNTLDNYAMDKINLHPDLQNDYSNIKLVKSSKEIIDSFDEEIISALHNVKAKDKLLDWINKNPINNESLTKLLNSECESSINSYLIKYLNNGNIPYNMKCFVGNLELDTFFVTDVKDINYKIIDDVIYISGLMEINAHVNIMIYSCVRDPEDDKYFNYGNSTINIQLKFSLTHKGEEGIEDLEINGVWKFREEREDDFA